MHFHNGDTLTSDDVVFTWQRFNTPGALARGTLTGIKDVRAIDPITVEIETAGPFPILLNALQGFYIMDRKWAEANGAAAASDLTAQQENYATRNENGTGPFRVVSRIARRPDRAGGVRGMVGHAGPRPRPRHLRAAPLGGDADREPDLRHDRRRR